jgi:predicted extracellular nuclease
VIGFNEIENDGYGPDSSIAFLVDKLNAATTPGTYAFIDADAATGQVNVLGNDAIRVGMIYKPGQVTLVGQTAVLNTEAFVNGGDSAPRNRPSLLQAFQVNANGARFIVDLNHLKSKGSACDAPDALDGQGNCNQVRVNSVNELLNWFATDPTGTGDPDLLMLGDYNSYAREDPITTLESAGFTNLVESFVGPDAYSYVFDGQWGYLDQALGTASLTSQVTGVADYHIDADEPTVLDYNTDFKSPGQLVSLYAPDQFRISDHDPVIVGLCTPPSLSVSVSPDTLWPANHKYKTVEASFVSSSDTASVNLISVTSNEPDNGLGDGDTANDIVIVDNDTIQLRAERAGNGDGRIYTITYQATNTCGATVTATATVTVPHNK